MPNTLEEFINSRLQNVPDTAMPSRELLYQNRLSGFLQNNKLVYSLDLNNLACHILLVLHRCQYAKGIEVGITEAVIVRNLPTKYKEEVPSKLYQHITMLLAQMVDALLVKEQKIGPRYLYRINL